MKYYITGDCHRHFERILFFCRHHATTKEDVMILLGDAGVNFFMDETDRALKRMLSELPVTFFFIHGNHEERPCNIPSYRTRLWKEGIVYYEPEYPNLLFARDGEIYNFKGKKTLVIGGAYSRDKEYRLLTGLPWFPDEQPSAAIRKRVERQLEITGYEVDYVLSHTAPMIYVPDQQYRLKTEITGEHTDYSTEEWLDQIEKKLHYKKWYFGHFHENFRYPSGEAEILYEEIKELGAEDYIQKLGRPAYRIGQNVYFTLESGQKDGYGKIRVVDSYGTIGQDKEVSYDIEGFVCSASGRKMLFKHVRESEIESMEEMTEKKS